MASSYLTNEPLMISSENQGKNYIKIFCLLLTFWLIISTSSLISAAWKFNTDDAYITLRYAKHLAQGDGITWNIGEKIPVEGYSNFLFVMIGAAALRLKLDPIMVFKIISCLSLAITCLLLYFLARIWLSPLLSFLPILILTSYDGTIWWTVSGLETAVYQMLAVGAVTAFVYGLKNIGRISHELLFLSGLLGFLAAITRPEGPVIGVALGVTIISAMALSHIDTRSGVRGAFTMLAISVIPYSIYLVWKLKYFHRILPNSVYCKAYNGPPVTLLMDFIGMAWPYILLSCAALRKKFDLRQLPLFLIPILYIIIFYKVDPIVGHLNRHFLTAFALFLVLSTIGIHNIREKFIHNRKQSIIEFFIILAFLALFIISLPITKRTLANSARQYAQRMSAREQLAGWLSQNLSSTDTYVIGDTGMIPFLTSAKVIDAYCLNCLELTSEPINRDFSQFANMIMARKPKIIIVPSYNQTSLKPHEYYGIYPLIIQHQLFTNEYSHVATFGAQGDKFWYWVYKLNA